MKQITFGNEDLDNAVTQFLKTIYWAISKMNIPEDEIKKYISSCTREISTKYNSIVPFFVGDSEEACLLNIVGDSLDKIDSSKGIEEQVEIFLTNIGMIHSDLVIHSFVIACNTKTITYAVIINKLHEIYGIEYKVAKPYLKSVFDKWLEQYPEVKRAFPRISFPSLLKVFAKRFQRDII